LLHDLTLGVVVPFVDIGGIVDHRYLTPNYKIIGL
jgi:hypothetical protein